MMKIAVRIEMGTMIIHWNHSDIIDCMLTTPLNPAPITNHDKGTPIETSIQKEAATVTSPKAYEVRHVNRNEIKEFIETWHYSHSINGLSATHCFGLYYKNVLIGGMIYGRMAMKGQSVKYQDTQVRDAVKAGIITETDADMTVIELRRLACIDDTARNTESYFISRTLKWLKHHTTIRTVVSYADTYYGHQGIIYQAANFQLLGQTAVGRIIEWTHADDNGNMITEHYHDHAIRTKYNGELKPFARRLKTALENAGLEEIKAMDETFDPNVHNAVMTDNLEDKEDGTITKVLQKGYKLKDKVIRPSMVAVNKK